MSTRRPYRSLRPLAVMALAVIFAGCTAPPDSQGKTGTPAPAGKSDFKVGLLLAGSPDDGGWNSLASEGLERIKQETGAHTSVQLAKKADMAQGFRDYARSGYSLVFGHGTEFSAAAEQAAREFPETYFVVSSGDVRGSNLNSIKFDIAQPAYLAGILAAGVSKTGVAGQIGGENFQAVAQGFRAFEKGGKSFRSDFRTLTDYVGDWTNANKAKEQALAMIRQKADVLFQNADAAGLGVFQAVKENHLLAIGSNADQSVIEPEIVIASTVLGVPEAFVQVANDVKNKTLRSDYYVEDLKGTARVVINPRLEARVQPAVRQRMEEAKAAILAGTLKVP